MKMKRINKYFDFINESNSEDMIHQLCNTYKIKNYSINDDLSIDVDDNVDLDYENLKTIPLKFRNVSGWFNCSYNQLTTLEGCPINVGKSFLCFRNKLTSLEGCPKFVGKSFKCGAGAIEHESNNIRTFHGIDQVKGNFVCIGNPIKEICNLFNDNLETHSYFINVVNTYETLFNGPYMIDGDTIEQIAEDLKVTLPPFGWRERLEKVGYQII